MNGAQHLGSADASPGARQRLVLLGASNLARCLSVVVATGQQVCAAAQPLHSPGQQTRPAPLEILAALGRGRSYGAEHCFLGREMPGILDCGLWAALKRHNDATISALVTDIGNDIVYGHSAETIAAWVETCLERLHEAGARVVMTRLPVGNLQTLSEGRFLFFRRLFFPDSRLTLAEVRKQVFALDERVIELGRRHDVAVVGHDTDWYGFDPIHIRRSIARAAWSTILGPLADEPIRPAGASAPAGASEPAGTAPHALRRSPPALLGYRDRYRLLRMKPAEYRRGNRVYRAAQPSGLLGSGAIVSLY